MVPIPDWGLGKPPPSSDLSQKFCQNDFALKGLVGLTTGDNKWIAPVSKPQDSGAVWTLPFLPPSSHLPTNRTIPRGSTRCPAVIPSLSLSLGQDVFVDLFCVCGTAVSILVKFPFSGLTCPSEILLPSPSNPKQTRLPPHAWACTSYLFLLFLAALFWVVDSFTK